MSLIRHSQKTIVAFVLFASFVSNDR